MYRSQLVCVSFLGALLIVCLSAGVGRAGDQEQKPSLEKVYKEAKELGKSAQTRDEAIAKYRAVVEMHMANEKLYQAALRDLGTCYASSAAAEEGIRFVFDQMEALRLVQERQKVLREVVGVIRLKQPEAFEKVMEQLRAAGRPKERPSRVMPSKALTDAILQRNDPDLCQKSLAKLGELLSQDASIDEQKTALATLNSVASVKFDRGPLRSQVLPLLKSKDDHVRMLAVRALRSVEAGPDELAHVVPLATDPSPEVRKLVASALVTMGKREHGDQIVPALTKLLGDSEPEVVDLTIRSMWGQYSTPQFDQLLVKLSQEPKRLGIVVYFGLSPMRTKSVAVCKRLVEVMQNPSVRADDRARAAWGLTYGVTDEAKSIVEAGLLTALPEEGNEDARTTQFRALSRVATDKSKPYLQSVVASEMESDACKELAQGILDSLNGKSKSNGGSCD